MGPLGCPETWVTQSNAESHPRRAKISFTQRLKSDITQLYICLINFSHISLEAFAATEFLKIFSGRQPRQSVEVVQRFRPYYLVKFIVSTVLCCHAAARIKNEMIQSCLMRFLSKDPHVATLSSVGGYCIAWRSGTYVGTDCAVRQSSESTALRAPTKFCFLQMNTTKCLLGFVA
jgi:hypothetical protein